MQKRMYRSNLKTTTNKVTFFFSCWKVEIKKDTFDSRKNDQTSFEMNRKV